MTGNLVQAANTQVLLTNGALAKNVFWQVAGYAHVLEGAHMEGNLLVKTDVLFATGSSLNGRVLAQTACTLQMATIVSTEPAANNGKGGGKGPSKGGVGIIFSSVVVGLFFVGSIGYIVRAQLTKRVEQPQPSTLTLTPMPAHEEI